MARNRSPAIGGHVRGAAWAVPFIAAAFALEPILVLIFHITRNSRSAAAD